MKEPDNTIKNILKDNMQRIEDDSFTKKVIELHLADKKTRTAKPFFNFAFLIGGISFVLISIGLVILFKTETILINDDVLNEQHGLILLAFALVLLVYKWLEEIITSSTASG